MPPKVSVVIPCYNAAAYLAETLTSILRQTLPPLEVLVVDDSSRDDSVSIARGFGDPVRAIVQPNQGACSARNRGIEEARGDWVAFIDADDVWAEAKLAAQFQDGPIPADVVCLHTGFYLFGLKNEVPPAPPGVLDGCHAIESLLLEPLVNTSTAVVRAGLPARFPSWAKAGGNGGDMLYFVELSQHGRFRYVAKPLVGYRMHPSQSTKGADHWIQHFNNRLRWLEEAGPRLGADRVARLRGLLHQQLLEWLRMARWTRQWDRHHGLLEFARGLDWQGDPPAVLSEWVGPRFVYAIKDFLDGLARRGVARTGRAAAR